MGIRLNDEASAIIAGILLNAKLRQLREEQEKTQQTEQAKMKEEV